MNRLKTTIISALQKILPEKIKNSFFHLSFHLARREFDYFAYKYGFAPNMELGLIAATERGLTPKTIIDVGAYHGDWSRMARRIWPDGRIVMFEPNAEKKDLLALTASDIGASVFSELLGAEDGLSVSYNVMESGSSILSERSPLQRVVEQRHLRRLDSVIGTIEGPTLLKIDTQGYEVEVLKGCTAVLPTIDAILLEVAVIEINEGAPLLQEVLSFVSSIGFVTYDILEIHRRPLDGALNQVDILFVRENSLLLADKRHFR
jgi:FkbM family methyltransferase